ncbi:MAG: YihY/virulence factor BrkB family protein [Terracidiphilus sp.]|jgi:membrane protein
MPRIFAKFRQAVLQALAHDVINTSKAAAYSGMLMLFPALLIVTTLVAQIQEGSTMLGELRSIYEQFLPTDTLDLLQSYVLSRHLSSDRLIFSAATLSLFAGLGVMLSLMEGFRRAYRLPMEDWGFVSRRLRALLLLPIALVPLSVATLVIVFGRQIELWIIHNAGHDFRYIVLFFWRMARWSVAFLTSTTVLASLYHFGTRRKEHWFWVGPGAVGGTLIWFPATLAYGWYVTRISDYSMFYGSFAAGIATLVWLYITSFSVLMGAELNGVLYRDRQEEKTAVELSAADEARSDSVQS